jgi:hypothetical protein
MRIRGNGDNAETLFSSFYASNDTTPLLPLLLRQSAGEMPIKFGRMQENASSSSLMRMEDPF